MSGPHTWRIAATLAMAMVAQAESPAPKDWATAALAKGHLVVWVVTPAPSTWIAREEDQPLQVLHLPTTVNEQTAGSFGTASSNIGQTAGSYGSRPSDMGTGLSGISQPVASSGPGSFGQPSSDVGQTAGNYDGRSTLGVPKAAKPKLMSVWGSGVLSDLRGEFPALDLAVFNISEQDLAHELRRTANTAEYPDVLLGTPLPWRWADFPGSTRRQLFLGTLGPALWNPSQTVESPDHLASWKRAGEGRGKSASAAILLAGQNRMEAEAFLVWLSEDAVCTGCVPEDARLREAEEVARAAVTVMLEGGGLTMTAPDAAPASAKWMQSFALEGTNASLQRLTVVTDVVRGAANDRVAAVEVRGIATSAQAFGITRTLVVLRRGEDAKWRVFHMSTSVLGGLAKQAEGWLARFCEDGDPVHVQGIGQASPPDGDNRLPQPDLLWDPGAGASMEVVEWQEKMGADVWTGPRLFFVPDHDPHLRTRVTATFLRTPGTYRWRVWTMGAGGAMVLSPWRSVLIQ